MSEPKVRVTREELEGHLRDQIGFLGSSSDSFDEGLRAEAKRLATSLRLLFHDTRHSESLLGQLDRLGGHFISTAFPVDAESLGSHLGLIGIRSGPRGTKYFALLDHAQNRRWLPFDDWWSEVVFIDESGREFSRRDLVLATADKHGGAHVDSELDEAFHSLASGKSLGWITETDAGPKAIPGGLEETLRQISHEVLATLLPTYTKKPELRGASAFAGMSVKLVDKDASQKRPPAAVRDTFERNDPCPCGSGKKFKKCHGALARGLPNRR